MKLKFMFIAISFKLTAVLIKLIAVLKTAHGGILEICYFTSISLQPPFL